MPSYVVAYKRVIEYAPDEHDARNQFLEELADINIHDQEFEIEVLNP